MLYRIGIWLFWYELFDGRVMGRKFLKMRVECDEDVLFKIWLCIEKRVIKEEIWDVVILV